jgi:hypothetical protein
MATTSKDKGNSFKIKKYELLQSAIVYGANASGKSNFLKALIFMRRVVLNRDKVILSTDRLPHYPFRLSTETEDSSSSFEIVFFIKKLNIDMVLRLITVLFMLNGSMLMRTERSLSFFIEILMKMNSMLIELNLKRGLDCESLKISFFFGNVTKRVERFQPLFCNGLVD